MPALRVCIMGHSGIGKSMVGRLFDVPGWDPLRLRKPRPGDAADAKVCISAVDFAAKRAAHPSSNSLYASAANNLEVHGDCAFFTVRGKQQFLPYFSNEFDARDTNAALRVEIYPPVLLELCNSYRLLSQASVTVVDPSQMVFLLLNPTAQDTLLMPGPAGNEELRLATALAVTERYRVQGKVPDLADVLGRVRSLDEEWTAWCGFLNSAFAGNCVEIKEWPHFEFRYYGNGQEHARSELLDARDRILAEVAKKSQALAGRLMRLMLKPSDIMRLDDIV